MNIRIHEQNSNLIIDARTIHQVTLVSHELIEKVCKSFHKIMIQ